MIDMPYSGVSSEDQYGLPVSGSTLLIDSGDQTHQDGVWQNSLAAERPAYNADFSEMTVKLRRGIFWSDGVEFTAADVVHTVATQIKHKNMRWSAALTLTVDAMETPDPYTVVFKLKKPNSRFLSRRADLGRKTHPTGNNHCQHFVGDRFKLDVFAIADIFPDDGGGLSIELVNA